MAITLLDMLLNAQLINRHQFDEALQNRVLYGGRIGTSLIELGFVDEETLARFLSSKLSVPYVPPQRLLNIPENVIALIPQDLALKYKVIPLRLEGKRLHLVMSDPADLTAVDEIAFASGYLIFPLITPEVRLMQALGKYYEMPVSSRYQAILDRISTAPTPPPAVSLPVEVEEHLEEAEVVEDLLDEPASRPDTPPDWSERMENYSVDSLSQKLAYAEDREQIADLLIQALRRKFDRGALFLIRKETASGWRGFTNHEETTSLDTLHIPLMRPSILKTALEGHSYYLGSLESSPLNSRLTAAFGDEWPSTVLVMPLSIMGRVVCILYLEGGGASLKEWVPNLQKLLNKAALAFEILICRDKILMS
ncbi:MAG: general secretion pathway protein GspE [Desulfuromonas sp.]|nr:MAG: general secretion pathway protein GspE [Desulfuromonas sp.]